ncbi:MAG: DNA mismatch endonuclease Vsr [Cyclobacteriaceae bacterium]|nr:DNA mismatch endonuclease Vsr [Cyclobacteriaceae bacterium]
MADVHKPEVRSHNMRQIKGKNTKPETLVRKFLHANGFRYRLHVKELPGKPDIVLPKYNTIIMVHGCFWHGHEGCKYFVIPKTRTQWWVDKINRTREKDLECTLELQQRGWKMLTVWECELKPDQRNKKLDFISKRIKGENE